MVNLSTSKLGLMRAMRAARRHTLSALMAALLGCGLASQTAYADEAQEVTRLLRAGQLDQAMSRADAFLVSKPRDAQMRFLKGLILTEQGKTTDAIQAFTRLTEDYPELPEPYNNLAVLYASQGQYDKARAALEMAIRTHPSYATAHENLGDVYSKLASQAYDKAFQLDGNNANAQAKLALIRDLIGGGKNRPTAVSSTASKPLNTAAATSTVASNQATTNKPSASNIEPPKPQVVPQTTPTNTANNNAVIVNPPKPLESKPEVKAEVKKDNEQEDVLKTVNAWAQAWSKQDTKNYLSAYGKEFDPPKGMNRAAWEKERRERIEGKGRIDVQVEQAQVSVNGNTATVKFRQNYKSDRLSTSSRKTLILQKSGAKWQIVEERTGG